jgi:DtxR family Mn-dependent transcriptional regulator
VGDIAAKLSVHKSTVTAALHSLADKQLISYRPYASPTLTQAGRRIAARVQHRHDVLKKFLQEVLMVEEPVAEANACRLEHAVDREILEHLADFVDFVQRCPRGAARWVRGSGYACDPEDFHGEKCEECLTAGLEELRRRRANSEGKP